MLEYVLIFAGGILFGLAIAGFFIRAQGRDTHEIAKQYGALDKQLDQLLRTTGELERILSDKTARGKWGEKRAEEIFQLAGFERDKHYKVQQSTRNAEGDLIRPDFTCTFTQGTVLHIDTKFPLDNYERYLVAENERDKQEAANKFVNDVRDQIHDLKNKGYIGVNTVSFVILFIPLESLFRFIHEQRTQIIEEALGQGVVLCSPLTLYIVLAIIRQTVDTFAYNKAASEIRQALDSLRREWKSYNGEMEHIRQALESAQTAYGHTVGIRSSKLQTQFDHVEATLERWRTWPE